MFWLFDFTARTHCMLGMWQQVSQRRCEHAVEPLLRVTPPAVVKIVATQATAIVAESKIGFYFSQRLQQPFLSIAACDTFFAASLAMLWFQNPCAHARQPTVASCTKNVAPCNTRFLQL